MTPRSFARPELLDVAIRVDLEPRRRRQRAAIGLLQRIRSGQTGGSPLLLDQQIDGFAGLAEMGAPPDAGWEFGP